MRLGAESARLSGTILLFLFCWAGAPVHCRCASKLRLWTAARAVVSLAAATRGIAAWSCKQWLHQLACLFHLNYLFFLSTQFIIFRFAFIQFYTTQMKKMFVCFFGESFAFGKFIREYRSNSKLHCEKYCFVELKKMHTYLILYESWGRKMYFIHRSFSYPAYKVNCWVVWCLCPACRRSWRIWSTSPPARSSLLRSLSVTTW